MSEFRLAPEAEAGKASDSKHGGVTDWTRLRRLKAAEIREGIQADPEAHTTDQ
jgi:hypothetical protein